MESVASSESRYAWIRERYECDAGVPIANRLIRYYQLSMRLILASASPRRAELLTRAGFEFEIRGRPTSTRRRRRRKRRLAYVVRVAREKAQADRVRNDSGRTPSILAADTVVVVDGESSVSRATTRMRERMLRRLSGKAHEVLTGSQSAPRTRDEQSEIATTRVWFRALIEPEIAWYVERESRRTRRARYAIQGLAARFIDANRRFVVERRRVAGGDGRSAAARDVRVGRLNGLTPCSRAQYSDGCSLPEILMKAKPIKIAVDRGRPGACVRRTLVLDAAGRHRVLQARRRGHEQPAARGKASGCSSTATSSTGRSS